MRCRSRARYAGRSTLIRSSCSDPPRRCRPQRPASIQHQRGLSADAPRGSPAQ
jgi:hypothetical protein